MDTWIHGMCYLQGVDVFSAVLEQTIVGVQHLVRQQVEPLPRHPAIVQPLLTLELHHQPLPHVLGSHLDHVSVTVLEHLAPAHLQPAVT